MARRGVCTAAACLDRGSRAHGELRGAAACLRDRTRPTSRRMASPAAAPGPVQGSSAQPPASGRFWGLVDVPKARIPPWPRLETGPPPGLDASPLRSAARPRAGSAQTPQLRSPPHASREPLGSRLSHQGREGHPPEEWALALRTHWVSDGPGTRGELATSACLDFSSDPAPPRSAQSPVGWLLRPRLVVPGSPPPGPGGPLSLTWPGSLLSGPPCTTH